MNFSVMIPPKLGVHQAWSVGGVDELSCEVPPNPTPCAILCCRCQSLEPAPGASQELPEAPQSPEAALPSLCLKQVFPKYAKQFSYLRLVDRVAALFIRFLGVKGTTKLGPTGFRTFIRSVGEELALSVLHPQLAGFMMPSSVEPVPVLV